MTGQTRAATKMMPVTLRAMFQRLNRALAKERCIVKAPPGRSHGSAAETGTYYLLNLERNELVASNLTVEKLVKLAREKGALALWEDVKS